MKQCNYSREALFQLNGIPPLGMSVSLALQHLVAMIVGCVTPAIIIANALGLPQSERVLLIQVSLVMSAVTTLIELFPIGGKLGSGLPVMFGISFAYLPSMQAIVGGGRDIATIAGAMVIGGIVAAVVGVFVKKIRRFFPPIITGTVVGGIVAVLVGIFIKKIRRLFPPVITGTVVFTIGLSLYPTAINYMAGGTGNTYEVVVLRKGLTSALVHGSWQNWAVAAFTLIVVMVMSNKGKGICKLAAILLGMIAGYIVAAVFGMVDLSEVRDAAWFSLPRFMHFGIKFEFSACIALALLFAINAIQAIGDLTATTVGGLNREPTDQELQGGIVTYGLTNVLSAFFGSLPTATYSQNVGIVTTNKVVNRVVFALAGGFLLLAGLIPKFSAILTTIPQCVLGGATITVFSTIAMTGMKLIASETISPRNTTIVGLSAALGVGISQSSSALSQFPESITIIFGKTPVVIATIMAVLLNLILPQENTDQ